MEPSEGVPPMNPVEFRDACLEMRCQEETAGRFFARRYAGEGWKATAAAMRWAALDGHLEDGAREDLLGPGDEALFAALEAAAECPLPEGEGFRREALRQGMVRRLSAARAEKDAVRQERAARRGA